MRIPQTNVAWTAVVLAAAGIAAAPGFGEDALLRGDLTLTGRVEHVEHTSTNSAPARILRRSAEKWLENPPSILHREADGTYTLGEKTSGASRPWSLTLRSGSLPAIFAPVRSVLPAAEVTLKIDPERDTYDAAEFGIGSRKRNLWITFEQTDDETWTSGLQLRRKF